MKLTVWMMFFAVFEIVASNMQAQNSKVSISKDDTEVKEVLKEIESQSKFTFFYNEGLINVNRKVTVNVTNRAVSEVLEEIFAGTGVSYLFMDDNIILSNQVQQDAENVQKQITVNGSVVDTKGEPIPGVNVFQKSNPQNGVITDIDGLFTMSLTSDNEVLVLSFIGFETQEIVVGSKTSLSITLVEESIGLDEVVAVGYGVTKRSSVTGAISSIKSDDLPKTANASVSNMLSGKASGVQVLQSSAQPGGGVNIIIRGAGSDKAGNQPLYVIDGFPVNNSNVDPTEGDYEVGSRNPLNSINPNDIESIEILKDAASTAIYGARAANGVILITTKRGKEGRTNVDFSYINSVQQIDRYYDMLDAKGFMEYSNILGKELYLISTNQYPYGPLDLDLSGYKPAYTQWEIAEAGSGTN